jgi:hypothetical protein
MSSRSLESLIQEVRVLAARIDALHETTCGVPVAGADRTGASSRRPAGIHVPDLCNPLPPYAVGTADEEGFSAVPARGTRRRG